MDAVVIVAMSVVSLSIQEHCYISMKRRDFCKITIHIRLIASTIPNIQCNALRCYNQIASSQSIVQYAFCSAFSCRRLTNFSSQKFPFHLVSPDLRVFRKTPGKSNYFSSVQTGVNRPNTFDCDVL